MDANVAVGWGGDILRRRKVLCSRVLALAALWMCLSLQARGMTYGSAVYSSASMDSTTIYGWVRLSSAA